VKAQRTTVLIALALCRSAAGDGVVSPPEEWARETRSPRPYAPSTDALWALCPEPDQALTAAARRIASAGTVPDDVAAALHQAGDPHVSARALLLEGSRLSGSEIRERVRGWLDGSPRLGRRRCGFALAATHEGSRFSAVTTDALADLAAVPVRVAAGRWVDIDAHVLVSAIGAKVVVQSPDGEVHGVPTSFSEGRVRAKANVDRPGAWVLQVLIEDRTGPRPALEATVFAGVEPFVPLPSEPPSDAASAALARADPAGALFQLLDSAREERGLSALLRDPRLDGLAQRHADRMRDERRLGHDVGDGDPGARLRAASYPARSVGENVAHANSATLAHRALFTSPSHRKNLLDPRFDRVGVAVSADADGTLWVAQLFARGG
jgi:uncharacterized protein YkwD